MTEEKNEKRVRAFYEAAVPGHRESLRGLQASRVVYDMPEGMPIGCGHFVGLQDVLDRFLTSFYRALDVHFVAEEFIAAGNEVVALGRIQGKTQACPSICLSLTSGQSVRGISNDCVLSPIRHCSPTRWRRTELCQISFVINGAQKLRFIKSTHNFKGEQNNGHKRCNNENRS